MKVYISAIAGILLSFSVQSFAAQTLVTPVTPDCGTNFETLRVATYTAVPPFEYRDQSGTLVGFDIEVARELQRRLRYENLCFVNTPLFRRSGVPQGSFLPSLTGGVVTMAISALNEINQASLQNDVAFVKYSDATQGLLFNAPVPQGLTPENALTVLSQSSGNVLGVLKDSAERQILVESFPPFSFTVFEFDTVAAGVTALKERTLNAFFSLDPVVNFQVAQDAGLAELNNVAIPANSRYKPLGLGIQVYSSCCQLAANIKQVIEEMRADGTLAKLSDEFKTGSFTPADFIPAGCEGTEPNLPMTNDISRFIFGKYCPLGDFKVVMSPSSPELINGL